MECDWIQLEMIALQNIFAAHGGTERRAIAANRRRLAIPGM
jgi:hypothetical protein